MIFNPELNTGASSHAPVRNKGIYLSTLEHMIRICLLVFMIGLPEISRAQDPFLQKGDKDLETVATRLMRTYQQELGMTVEQAILFRDKVEEFQIRREEVKTRNLPVKEALHILRALSRQETAEMANILTQPQLRAYRNLKRDIQPVELVVGQVEPPE